MPCGRSVKGFGKVRKRSGTKTRFKVSWHGRTTAKSTTKAKAKRQRRLLYAVAHGWKPTGRRG